jgi:hypothetical protein
VPETSREQTDPRIAQLAIFLPNRLGALKQVTQRLDEAQVRILGLSVMDSADHAVVRTVVDRPAKAMGALKEAGYGACESEILCVAVPPGSTSPIQKVLGALVGAEVNVMYAYALLARLEGQSLLALQTDDSAMAERVLRARGFALAHQDDLGEARD